ncbi:NAD(P)-dependent alcohol dehydrogenase [Arthrobacter sp. I2-34]|uniref:NAD(P)-dependent alcohol dehydrogenase n=1 Tax=Arthrobacter hankyongi TaxID=2904801 RepID=A0ABS9L710_9MICC|nr:NAD(P)-dependent alcohol dehydrogenase [Arthrobacter hankyongi]MCG2622465.1 NAD(P)-dependent alcohol dehydrogenase [Arthrobacter hankyongi]
MKAIVQDVYGSPDVLRLADIDTPEPGDDDVLVQMRAAGVDAGVWHLMAGQPYLLRLGFGLRGPKVRVRGRDVAGIVSAVGRNVTRFRPGDEVFGTAPAGSYAEYACTRENRLEPKPANLSFEQAAAVPVSACAALHGLRDAGRLQQGQAVLILGAGGGVGTFAVQLAKAFGATVTGVCSAAKADLVRSIGADHVIDYAREDFADGARRYDLILDIAGNNPLTRLRRALAPGGTLVIAGGEGGGRVFGGIDRQLRASLLSPFTRQKLRTFVSAERQEDLRDLRGLIEAGQLTPVIDRTYPLVEAADAIRRLRAGQARGKLVVTV